MTELSLAPADLAGLDALEADALVVPLFEAFAQPQGTAGLIDWRLCGRLGRLILDRHFLGRPKEHLLTTSAGRLAVARIFLLGLGPAEAPIDAVPELRRVLLDAQVKEVALAIPEGGAALLERWLEGEWGSSLSRLVVLDPGGIEELVARAKRKGAWS